MTRSWDVAIAGLGAMGSAAAYHLARRGARVIGFDRFAPPHALGSSHGETRIIREAYFEDPRYVPLVQRALVLWRELEASSGRTLLKETGGIMIGPPEGVLVTGAEASGKANQLPYERLDAADITRRFPAFAPRADWIGIWEPRAGALFPEACVDAHLNGARAAGAEIRPDEPVVSWRASPEGVEIETARGRCAAGALVLAAGAWLPTLMGPLDLRLTVTRQPLVWFEPAPPLERFAPERFPIWICEHQAGRFIYGFPAFEGRLKAAVHQEGEVTTADLLERSPRESDVRALAEPLERLLPGATRRFHSALVCMYTNSQDQHFVLDRHPEHANVVVVSACSGHGFKFAGAIGEIVAKLIHDEPADFDLGLFRIARGVC
jgi:sarcosine oxidase